MEPDILGRAYEYLLRKFAEGQGQTAGEFFTPKEVGWLIAYLLCPKEEQTVYDPTCGSGGLLIKCQLALRETIPDSKIPMNLYGQEINPVTFAIAKMNMIIHDMEGEISIGDSLRNPKFIDTLAIRKFDLIVANPMWNQPNYTNDFYESDTFGRFRIGHAPANNADWGWLQHISASLKNNGRAAIVLDTGSVSRGSGELGNRKERDIRKAFVDGDLIEGVILLPENLFYNANGPGVIIVINRSKNENLRHKVVLLDASRIFKKGKPKNFIPDEKIQEIANAFNKASEVQGFVKVVSVEEVAKKNYNLYPSRYIDNLTAEEYHEIHPLLDGLSEQEAEDEKIRSEIESLIVKFALASRSDRDEDAKQDVEFGIIPKRWRVVNLGDQSLFEISTGGTPSTKNPEYYNGDIRWLKSGDIKGLYIDESPNKISKLGMENSNAKVHPAGSVMLAMSGRGKTRGTTAVLRVPSACSQSVAAIIPQSDEIVPEFIHFNLSYRYNELRNVTGSKDRSGLNLSLIRMIKFPLPSKKEQEEIAGALIKLHSAKELQEKKRRTYDSLTKSVLKKLMTDGISPVDSDT